MSTHPERVRGLETDIDCRVAELWLDVWSPNGVLADLTEAETAAVAALTRAAYGRGYMDALREDKEGRRGELATAHGYAQP